MKTIQKALLLIGLTVMTMAAGDENNDAIKQDMAGLQGEWSMVSGSADGYPLPVEMSGKSKRVCKGNETIVTVGDMLMMKATITLDPSKKPRSIDYQMTDGFTKGKTQFGIYQLDGDILKSCFAAPGAARPKDYTGGTGITSTVWKRVKK